MLNINVLCLLSISGSQHNIFAFLASVAKFTDVLISNLHIHRTGRRALSQQFIASPHRWIVVGSAAAAAVAAAIVAVAAGADDGDDGDRVVDGYCGDRCR